MSEVEARTFFLKPESYCSIDLPPYFDFTEIVNKCAEELKANKLSNLWENAPSGFEDVNYLLLQNKDGLYAWRPLEVIHPTLYGNLVNELTQKNAWKQIIKRFKEFQKDKRLFEKI